MPITIYNSLSRAKEEFVPIIPNHVGIYSCGPTVYDTAHIGNFRTFVLTDIVRRVLMYNKYEVTLVMNSTDVDDKTIKRSQENNQTLSELTGHYETLFLAELHSLNILTPTMFLRATDHIKEMIEMIQALLDKNIAYIAEDGVYFSIAKFPEYGKMANITLNSHKSNARERIVNDEYDKDDPRDFALWKFYTDTDGNNVWDAPFGKGRPGWSIECSAMAKTALGKTIDIHMGGIDLLFPHHTNEIAQSESLHEATFANYWIHGEFMTMNQEKMSKSKNNILKLQDLEAVGISPMGYRYWLLTAHYRSQVNFTIEAVRGAQNAFIRLVEHFIDISITKHIHDDHHHHHAVVSEPIDYRLEFNKIINDDFNMPEAIALVWKLLKDEAIESSEKSLMLLDFDKVFGLGLGAILEMTRETLAEELPPEITALVSARENARIEKDFVQADALRKEIEARGYTLKDTSDGPKVVRM